MSRQHLIIVSRIWFYLGGRSCLLSVGSLLPISTLLITALFFSGLPQEALGQDPFGSSGVQVEEQETQVKKAEIPAANIKAQKESVNSLISLMNAADDNARVEAHYLLLHAVSPGIAKYLVEKTKGGNRVETQVALIEALREVGDEKTAKELLFELDYGALPARIAVVSALGKLGGDNMVAKLFDLLAGPLEQPLEIRKKAAIALSEIRTAKAKYSLQAAKSRITKDFKGQTENPLVQVVDWSVGRAEGKYDVPVTEENIPKGQTVNLRFKGMEYHFYRPPFDGRRWEKPFVLVCLHDKTYNIKQTYEDCRKLVGKERVAILVPVFDAIRFPDYQELNYRGLRADTVLLELVEFLADRADVVGREIYLWGFGEGGSFAHRFAYAHPERVARVLFATEDYTPIIEDVYYPKGLKPSPFSPSMEFDIAKIAKLDLAYYKNLKIKEKTVFTQLPPMVEQFRTSCKNAELNPRLVWLQDNSVNLDKFGKWVFPSFDVD